MNNIAIDDEQVESAPLPVYPFIDQGNIRNNPVISIWNLTEDNFKLLCEALDKLSSHKHNVLAQYNELTVENSRNEAIVSLISSLSKDIENISVMRHYINHNRLK